MILFSIPVGAGVVTLFYGKYLKTAEGAPIGARRAIKIIVCEVAIWVGIIIVGAVAVGAVGG
jgi:hypothetical protein